MYPQVEAILACTADGTIGRGDLIPWTLRGDLRRFFKLTSQQALLIGVKTLLGIAKNYVDPGKVVLPNRDLFVVMEPRSSESPSVLKRELELAVSTFGCRLDSEKLHVVLKEPDSNPNDCLNEILSKILHRKKLFVAGGASVYEIFLPYASKVHVTLVSNAVSPIKGDVKLSRSLFERLFHQENGVYDCMWVHGTELDGDVSARYITLEK